MITKKHIRSIITIPKMNYLVVKGAGNPNFEDGEYKQAIGLLYSIAYIIKMSYKDSHKIDGYLKYVVPPLEGFWWINGLLLSKYKNMILVEYLQDAMI